MTVDISGASDESAVLSALPPSSPPGEVGHGLTPHRIGTLGNLQAGLAQLARKPIFIVALLYVLFVVVSAVFPSWFEQRATVRHVPHDVMQSPSLHHLFGTDNIGRDLWTRVLYGYTLTIKATLLAIVIGLVAGLSFGVVSGFYGGWADALIMRIVDTLLAIPALLFALAIITSVGYGTIPVALAVGLGVVPGFARTTRAEVLRVKTQPFIEAAGLAALLDARADAAHPAELLGAGGRAGRPRRGVVIIAIASCSFLGLAHAASEWAR